jgi:PD-(D/E)XK nuclease superfamily
VQLWRQSEIEDMLICPERSRRNNHTGELAGTSASILMGNAVHETIASSLVALRDWGLWDEPYEVGEIAREHFVDLTVSDEQADDPINWRPGTFEERAAQVEVMATALWEHMPGFLELWGEPLLIEHTFSKAPVLYDIGLEGTWDLLTDKYVLVDWKTAKTSWRPGREITKVQPIVYARGVEHVTGRWPEAFYFVVVNRRGDIRVKPVDCSKERYKFLEAQLPPLERMRLNNIYPMNPTSPLCNAEDCPWFTRGCPAGKFKGLP